MNPVTTAAPGKVVLWGEYAVLADAPAAVLAVDRYATCSLRPATMSGWTFTPQGIDAPPVTVTLPTLLNGPVPEPHQPHFLMWHALAAIKDLGWTSDLPPDLDIHTDSTGFSESGRKIGIGSSAAVCVASYFALINLLGRSAETATHLPIVKAAHRQAQGGGSGLDVAAAWLGGLISYEQKASPRSLSDPPLHWQFVFVGESASTPAKLGAFARWRNGQTPPELEDLKVHAQNLCNQPCLEGLRAYVRALHVLDQAAELGIYSTTHNLLDRVAKQHDLVYKPCGAGGGDIGMFVSDSKSRLTTFMSTLNLSDTAVIPLSMEKSQHGVEVRR
jgi:phosphomevalonate kinase